MTSVLSQDENIMLALVFETDFWIGFDDKATEDEFVWADGSEVSYTNWGWGEPNDWGTQYGFAGEDCAYIRIYDGKWNDVNCIYNKQYACKYATEELTIAARNYNPS